MRFLLLTALSQLSYNLSTGFISLQDFTRPVPSTTSDFPHAQEQQSLVPDTCVCFAGG